MIDTNSRVGIDIFCLKRETPLSRSENLMNFAKSVSSVALSGISQAASATADFSFQTASKAIDVTKDVAHIGLQTVSNLANFAGHSVLWAGTLGMAAGLFDAYTCASGIPTPWKEYNVYRSSKTLFENAKIYQDQGKPECIAKWGDFFPKPMNDMISEQLGVCAGMLVAAPIAAKLCYTVGDLAKRVDLLF